ncbi:hypothetical protein [Methyloversatilis sp.]|uniref:hypothetical protein n=1 Tax=Methyloversatilis sp. TaxID=2569862 RepID=UPI0035B0ED77
MPIIDAPLDASRPVRRRMKGKPRMASEKSDACRRPQRMRRENEFSGERNSAAPKDPAADVRLEDDVATD